MTDPFSMLSRLTRPRQLGILLLVGLCAPDSFAEQPASSQQSQLKQAQLGHIEVTARKKAETLQQVPISLSVAGGADLAEKGVTTLTEVARYSPNTSLLSSRGTNSTLTAFIRGLGQLDPLWGYESGVGVYVDDVYLARPQGALLNLLDTERIEILRGPQGTLYGKNTIGGAIRYVTKALTGDPGLTVEGTLGAYDQADFRLSGQYPLIDDTMFIAVAFANLQRDGYGEYLATSLADQNLENYNKDVQIARLTLELHPFEQLFIRLAWDETQDNSNARGGFRLLPSTRFDVMAPASVFDASTSLPTRNQVEMEGSSWQVLYAPDADIQMKYIGSRRTSYSQTNIDIDSTAMDILDVPAVYDDKNHTHEIQLNVDKTAFQWVGGVYFYDGDACGVFDGILGVLGRDLASQGVLEATTSGVTSQVAGCNNSRSWAGYAHLDYALSGNWTLSMGARYTDEHREASVFNDIVPFILYPQSGWIPGYQRPADMPLNQVLGADTDNDGKPDASTRQSWQRFTPKLGLTYHYSPYTMYYVSYAQGFKSGTFNQRATTNEPGVEPEVVDSVELGVKSDITDTLRINASAFSYIHSDRQYLGFDGTSDNLTALQQQLRNAAKTRGSGLETEITYAVTPGLSLYLTYGLLNFTIKENLATPPLVGQAHSPEQTVNLAAQYTLDTQLGFFTFNANYYYRDDYLIFETSDVLSQPGFGVADMSISWESPELNWYGGLHLKNISDEVYLTGGYEFVQRNEDGSFAPGLGNDTTLVGYYGDPRTLQLTIGYRF